MSDEAGVLDGSDQYEHKGAYVFEGLGSPEESSRPTKRRKVAPNGSMAQQSESQTLFVPLFGGLEKPECVKGRQQLFEEAWHTTSDRIEAVLQDANRSTIEEITAFVDETSGDSDKLPSGFIITGPNAASEELLFVQLSRTLRRNGSAAYVQLQSAEAPNLKAALKKIILNGTARSSRGADDDGDEEVAVGQDGRKYLNYDLEALHVAMKNRRITQVIIALQDCEAFGTGLLTDLISLFHSWRDRIRFTLLFGIATSVEMLQARLPKVTTRQLQGRQFDVVQQSTVLASIVKSAVAAPELKIRIGPSLLKMFVERLQNQMAGIHSFVSSLKYAYMCHFWANPLSLLALGERPSLSKLLQKEHFESLRSLSSFRRRVDVLVDEGDTAGALALLEDDDALLDDVLLQMAGKHDNDVRITETMRLIISSQIVSKDFTGLYQDAIDNGIDLAADESSFVLPLKRLPPEEFVALAKRLLDLSKGGKLPEPSNGWHQRRQKLAANLASVIKTTEKLIKEASSNGGVLRSAYSGKSRVVRATVVAQKVQLSQDTAKLTAEDKAYTELIDGFTEALCEVTACKPLSNAAYHEVWLFDAKMPYRDVVIPKPGSTFERALLQSHDYLGCKCCVRPDDGVIASNMPAAAILYQLYLEAGSYINVADLWSSFAATVGSVDEAGEPDRQTLLRFYRGLAELKAMGFVKQSRKKADHVAKVKWL